MNYLLLELKEIIRRNDFEMNVYQASKFYVKLRWVKNGSEKNCNKTKMLKSNSNNNNNNKWNF